MMAVNASKLEDAKQALVHLQTLDALLHLEAALQSLEGLSKELHEKGRPSAQDQRELERSLLRFRKELRDAGLLAEQGLAFCKDWTEILSPPPGYSPDGSVDRASETKHEISVEG
jgi:hypothetical protein